MPQQVTTPGTRPGLSIPNYELLRPIGRGAYGEVWLARNVTGSWVALKIVHRAAFDHDRPFEREFEGIQRFEPISRSDPSQVAILHVGLGDGFFYYVMELADSADGAEEKRSGGEKGESPSAPFPLFSSATYTPLTLKRLLNDRGHLPSDECLAIALSLTRALAHLHGHGLVHRDVKPSNVIFVNGQAKLADIGLVTSVDATRSFVGTEGYLPPEGAGTPAADLYSLGKVLYEMSTGCDRKEFPALPPDIATRPDRDALAELNAIIVRACQLDPQQRYTSAEEMRGELALVQRGQSVRRKRAVQHHFSVAKRIALAISVLALLLSALIFLKVSRTEYTPSPEAARLYADGQWYYSQLTPEDHQKALKSLTQAVQKYPKFVRPYGELTGLYTWLMLPGITNEQYRLQIVKELADKALAIDPDAAEGHIALSWCKFLERDWRGAEAEIARSIQLNPNLPIAHGIYSFYLSMQGRTAEARQAGQRANALSPPGSERVTAIIASWPFLTERHFDLAAAQLKRVLELDRNFSSGHGYLARVYEAQSNYVAAIEEDKTRALLVGQDPARVAAAYGALRQAYDTQGDQGYLRKKIELIHADLLLPEDQQMFVDSADGYYARLGEKEKALGELEEHFDEPQFWHQLKFDPLYDSLHDEPRFKALLKRAGLEK